MKKTYTIDGAVYEIHGDTVTTGTPKEHLCAHCHTRPATINWVGEGGVMDYIHGGYERWCEICCTKEQLKHAKKVAKRIPILEKKLKRLK